MSDDDYQYLFDKLILSEITDNYENALDTLFELSKFSFFVTKEDLEMFDFSLKKTISVKRRQYQRLEFLILSVDLSESVSKKMSNGNIVLGQHNKDRAIINEETRNLIRNTVNKEEEVDLVFNLKVDKKEEVLGKLFSDLSNELPILYNKVLIICDNFLENLKNNDMPEVRLFFLKTKADHKRYKYEISIRLDDKLDTGLQYGEALKEAVKIKQNNKTDLSYLKFYLNYTVYLHDIMEDKEKAIEIAQNVLKEGLFLFDEINNNYQKDVILICQTLKDNIAMWLQTDSIGLL